MASFDINVAAINWFDSSNGLHIRVYASDGNTITERCMDAGNNAWTTGDFKQPGTTASATVWVDSQGSHIRVYAVNEGVTTEWCADPGNGGWTQGSYAPA